MVRHLFYAAVAAVLTGGIVFAGQSAGTVASTDKQIPATNGTELFGHYCTPCHGVDGRGHGPVVVEQKAPPVDLTVLSRKNHGTFPEAHVVHVLQYGAQILPHTSVEMPVWGPVLGKINQSDPRDKLVRIKSLTNYLESIQSK